MNVFLALFLYAAVPVHAEPIVIPEMGMAIARLSNAIEIGLSLIKDRDEAPSQAVLDLIGSSLAGINIGMQKRYRQDPQTAQDDVANLLKSAVRPAFRRHQSVSVVEARLKREFLEKIKDIVLSEKIADYTAQAAREWRAGRGGRVVAYAQIGGFVATVAVLVGVVAHHFDVASAKAIWETVVGTSMFSGGVVLAMYGHLPLTRRFRNNTNVVLKPVYDCTNQLLEETSIPMPRVQVSSGSMPRGRRRPGRRPPAKPGTY